MNINIKYTLTWLSDMKKNDLVILCQVPGWNQVNVYVHVCIGMYVHRYRHKL